MSLNTPIHEVERLLGESQEAFFVLKNKNIAERAAFMHLVADEIESLGEELITTAQKESNLPTARLVGEKGRTIFQWRSYADALISGHILPVRIDTALPDRTPPRPDLRKTYTPLGPVAVFGASNFPFAFSTLGGDTASAIAAGCPVIVKAHPAHPKTASIMESAIMKAIEKTGLPTGVFAQVFSENYEVGQLLVTHPIIQAVGFTGSFAGGKALFDLASKRVQPIPVFAEMGSVNPVFLLPAKMKSFGNQLAAQYIGSLTLGVGQFCTNPGILVAPDNEDLPGFIEVLKEELLKVSPVTMLHDGIAKAYHKNKKLVSEQDGVEVLAAVAEGELNQGNPILARTSSRAFLSNETLGMEVFGPFGMLVTYKNEEELLSIARTIEGQLTLTLLAEPEDLEQHTQLVSLVREKCGRLILNGFPTGVEVSYGMQHGGPFPSTTDSRFTSVGPDAIKRFARPVSYQNWEDRFLPDELKNANPLGIWRTINTELTRHPIE